jgi:hypothetical protein
MDRPALPVSLHKKYVGPVKDRILSGLQRPNEGHTLSLIFQGLANLAKFEGWGSVQQSELAMDLLAMTQEIPKDSQHAALNAISRLLSVPQEGLDVYELLISVHATFGGRVTKLDSDLKALVSGIYGHLGTVERNVSDLCCENKWRANLRAFSADHQSRKFILLTLPNGRRTLKRLLTVKHRYIHPKPYFSRKSQRSVRNTVQRVRRISIGWYRKTSFQRYLPRTKPAKSEPLCWK